MVLFDHNLARFFCETGSYEFQGYLALKFNATRSDVILFHDRRTVEQKVSVKPGALMYLNT
jgi:hypothetical protein